MMMWFLSWIAFMCCTMFFDVHMLYHSCILGMKTISSWCMIF
jgi:hypothetical protein